MIRFELPIRTLNPLNGAQGRHWGSTAKKRENERKWVLAKMPQLKLQPAYVVTLTRHSPGELDDDGLHAALKTVRDAVASRMRVDDRTQLVKWEYLQAKGPAKVVVEICGTTPVAMSPLAPIQAIEAIEPFDADDFNGRPRR